MNKKISLALCLLLLAGCSNETVTTNNNESETPVQETSTKSEEETEVEENLITFNDTEVTTTGKGEVSETTVSITEPGEYTVTGSSEDGHLIIELGEDEDITLNLENLTLSSQTDAPIQVIEGDDLTINLIGESSISDSASNQEMQAPIYIDEVKTEIVGDGTLNLTGNAQEGLEINNELTITSGTINIVEAVDDGINAGDALIINGGEVKVNSGGDGIDSNGYMEINGGDIIVSSGLHGNGPIDYGDDQESYLEINGGNIIAVGGDMGVEPEDGGQVYHASSASGQTLTVQGQDYEFENGFNYYFVSTETMTDSDVISVDGTEIIYEENSTMMQMRH